MGYVNYRAEPVSAPGTLLGDLALLGEAFGSVFTALTRIRFEAPWTDYSGRVR